MFVHPSASPGRPLRSRLVSLPRSAARSLCPASFGSRPAGERLARVQASPQFADGIFRNELPTRTLLPGTGGALLREVLFGAGRGHRRPAAPVPLYRPAPGAPAAAPGTGLRLTWLGHATVLAEIDGHRVLFDPVWGERCSPFGFVGPRRLHPVPLALDRIGPLDAVVISHDHYDHLDMFTVRALLATRAVFAVPLGVGAHLEHWGVPGERIAELDWHESAQVGGLTLTATPGRHFCGRGVRNHGVTLWASWVVAGSGHRVFHSGDTGYFPGFARIGAEHGPFDATMMQVGAYSEFWPDVHMTPEEGLRAHRDLSGGHPRGVLLPIHWGTFNLALHSWDEPVERTVNGARPLDVTVAVPRPGEPFEPAKEAPVDHWWRPVAAAGVRRREPGG
ncbi:MBL fold metallo-hydrolase [Streptomyces sodiiphilus]|uniref:MBL fold metallo-hydrolase n=1 Tax=Streptomyces sodiiphilus TaxID=226217 RepID=A0ABP5B6H3_9ACTN